MGYDSSLVFGLWALHGPSPAVAGRGLRLILYQPLTRLLRSGWSPGHRYRLHAIKKINWWSGWISAV